MRDNAKEVLRPALGRKPNKIAVPKQNNRPTKEAAKIQTGETLTKNPHPDYLAKGPLITQQMFDKADWPKILNIPEATSPITNDETKSSRPIRQTRNPNPKY